jgi:hypothetical protein
MSRRCPACGREVAEAPYCPYCSRPTVEAKPVPPPSAGQNTRRSANLEKRPDTADNRKAQLRGALLGAGVALALVVAFLIVIQILAGGRAEAGADFAFVVLLVSPCIVGGGVAVGILIAVLIQRGRGVSLNNRVEQDVAAGRSRE